MSNMACSEEDVSNTAWFKKHGANILVDCRYPKEVQTGKTARVLHTKLHEHVALGRAELHCSPRKGRVPYVFASAKILNSGQDGFTKRDPDFATALFQNLADLGNEDCLADLGKRDCKSSSDDCSDANSFYETSDSHDEDEESKQEDGECREQ